MAVEYQDFGQFECRRGGINLPGESVLDQPGQIPYMVNMGMGEDDSIDIGRIKGHGRPVAPAQRFRSLEHPAVYEDFFIGDGKQVFRPGNCPCGPVKS